MKQLSILFFVLISTCALTQTYQIGVRIQKTQTMYWESGFSMQYSFQNLKPKQLYVGFDYVTSRLGSALNSNALKQDQFIFNTTWAFRPVKSFRVLGRINFGYFVADYEEPMFESLPNTAFLLSPELLLQYQFKEVPITLNLGSGYYLDFAKAGYSPGTFQPLYYHLDVLFTLVNSKNHE
jgi:hypothetical protein